MSVIAVAGGTGSLGRAIVDALISEGNDVVVLARETSKSKEKEIGVRILAANYDDVPFLVGLLEDNNVELVISTLNPVGNAGPETSLIQAADMSSTTKRYIPSIWAIKYTEELATCFPLASIKIGYRTALDATSLQHTSVLNGYFLDYYVAPQVNTYLDPLALVFDIPHNFAAIPGSGDVPVVFTHTFHIARFVAALIKQSKWEKESYIIGDKVTLNEFLRLIDNTKATRFTVAYDPVDKLKTGKITELPSHPSVYPFFPKEILQGVFSAFGLMFKQGAFDLKPSRSLNDQFPEIKPRSVKELMFQAWKKD